MAKRRDATEAAPERSKARFMVVVFGDGGANTGERWCPAGAHRTTVLLAIAANYAFCATVEHGTAAAVRFCGEKQQPANMVKAAARVAAWLGGAQRALASALSAAVQSTGRLLSRAPEATQGAAATATEAQPAVQVGNS